MQTSDSYGNPAYQVKASSDLNFGYDQQINLDSGKLDSDHSFKRPFTELRSSLDDTEILLEPSIKNIIKSVNK